MNVHSWEVDLSSSSLGLTKNHRQDRNAKGKSKKNNTTQWKKSK